MDRSLAVVKELVWLNESMNHTVQYSCHKNAWTIWKGIKMWQVEDEPNTLEGVQYATGKSRGQTIHHHSHPVSAPTSNAQEAEVDRFYEDLPIRPSRTNTKKDVLFSIGDWNAKVGCQEIPQVMGKFGLVVQNEAGQRLIEFCQQNALITANTLFQQHKRQLYTWTPPNGQYLNQIDFVLCSWRWKNSIQSAKTRPGANSGSHHELFITKFRLKLKKVGNATRPFRYALNKILYEYTEEVINRFKGLDQVDRVPKELWTEVCDTAQEAVTTHPKEKEMQEGKVVVWRGFANSWVKKSEKQRRNRKIYPTEYKVPENNKGR